MARIVVIGAGVGGMAVAARLRVKGHHVTVVEAAPHAGGALATLRRDGFAFDLGPTVFTLPAVYRDLFLKTGGALEDNVELLPLDPGTRHRFADGSAVTLPGVGVGQTAAAIGAALGEHSGADWRALMAHAGQIWATIRRPVLETPLTDEADLAALLDDRAARRLLAPRRSLRDLGRSLHDRRARQILEHYALHAGADPRTASGTLVTLPYVEATFGTWHVGGGLGSLADALRRRLDERGVILQLGTRASAIRTSDGRITGVEVTAAGEPASAAEPADLGQDQTSTAIPRVLDADIVVTDLDPALVQRDLLDQKPQDPPGALLRRQRTTHSAGAFQLLLAVRGRTPGVGHVTVWHPQAPDEELDAVFGRRPRPVARPTMRTCVPADPSMHPAGHESWTLQVTAPRHSPGGRDVGTIDWDAPGLASRYADDLLDELARRGGPDLRDRILWREVRTPACFERRTSALGGATHGSTTQPRGLLGRAPNASTVEGLFHVGAAAHPGPGLPLVGLSAELVATLIGRA